MSDEETLDLSAAASFLHMSVETLRGRAKQGIIKGVKPAKCWVFLKSDLVEYLNSLYIPSTGHVPSSGCDDKEVILCHSTNAVKSGGFGSLLQMDGEYEELLELKTRKPPVNTMIG
ncbi:MAG: DNA-binding protein [Proteobacteria bacterium]|nr:DNA-binding protein [Pseudomonadota bacterium]